MKSPMGYSVWDNYSLAIKKRPCAGIIVGWKAVRFRQGNADVVLMALRLTVFRYSAYSILEIQVDTSREKQFIVLKPPVSC